MSEAYNFIHLRTYSSYSLLEGAIKVPDLVAKVRDNNMPAIAVTDKGNLFAALEFSTAASDKGLQPIIGCDFNFDPQIEDNNKLKQDRILVIAKNAIGYQNLLKISSYYYSQNEEVITLDFLRGFADGLIVLSGAHTGTLNRLLIEKKRDLAEKFLTELSRVFPDHLYVEIMRVGVSEDDLVEDSLIELAYKHNIPLVATNNVYFLEKEMHEAHEVLLCIADNKYLADEGRRIVTQNCYLKSASEMANLFADIPEAIENTVEIARRCSIKSEVHKTSFPEYKVTLGKNENEELRILAKQGLVGRLDLVNSLDPLDGEEKLAREKVYTDRCDYELNVIEQMGFAGYFLIVSDFIRWAKREGIPVGPGRGSGAGSVVSWTLDITDVDPIKFGLLFERFLNPERVSLPDLDIDFCQDRRDEVIRYVQEKYGKDKVAHIITFGKLQARAVVRDVGRVLSLPYTQVDMIAKMIPFNAVNPVSLEKAIEMEPGLSAARKSDSRIAKLLDISLKLEGLHRHASTHAAGIVISRSKLDEVVPLYKDSKGGIPVIQYSMKYAEAAGLIKFDFLGLKTLTVISNCVDLIHKKDLHFDLNKINFSDKKTFEMLSRGKSSGVFQFESMGMKDYLNQMKPDSIEDIIALGALYRPGPMDNIPRYIECKHGREVPQYPHPKLENVLQKTFGVAIYQEQVMEIARSLAGYTLGAADSLRKAMGKKIKAEMDAQREIFVKGCIANDIEEKKAIEIFELVAKFAGYGFNKAHAVAYGVISYQTAYLKANYPVEMMVSILNTEIDDTDKISLFIEDARGIGISVESPDINLSEAYFSIDKETSGIRYALGAIKNVGVNAMRDLVFERDKNGFYQDIKDLVQRVGNSVLNKRQLEYLVKSGALDSLHSNRNSLCESVNMLIDYSNKYLEEKNSQQINLFGRAGDSAEYDLQLSQVTDWDFDEKLNNECAAIGFYLSGHPLGVYEEYFKKISVLGATQIRNELGVGRFSIKMAGIPVAVKIKSSPKGRYMILSFSTSSGILDVTIFDDQILEKSRDIIYGKVPLIIQAEVRKEGEMERITVQSLGRLDSYLQQQNHAITIEIENIDAIKNLSSFISESKDSNNSSIFLKLKVYGNVVTMSLPSVYVCNLNKVSMTNLPQGVLAIHHNT